MARIVKGIGELSSSVLGRKRRKELEERIAAVRRLGYGDPHEQEPPAIKAARRLLDRYDRRISDRRGRQQSEIAGACRTATSALLFADDVKSAVAIVEGLESMAKRRRWTRA